MTSNTGHYTSLLSDDTRTTANAINPDVCHIMYSILHPVIISATCGVTQAGVKDAGSNFRRCINTLYAIHSSRNLTAAALLQH